jgi:hypothetical protein
MRLKQPRTKAIIMLVTNALIAGTVFISRGGWITMKPADDRFKEFCLGKMPDRLRRIVPQFIFHL